MVENILLGKKKIGLGAPCYMIAEAGVNHNGDLDLALKLVREAKRIGVDCIKFQTFKAESVLIPEAPKANYQLKTTNPNESQFEMLKKLELSFEHYKNIVSLCEELDIEFLSTPYSREDADFLNELGVNGFKIASGQLIEHAFLSYVAKFQKPMIISTGMATLAEVYEAVETIRKEGNNKIIVLQCTTNYPSKNEDANIRAMVTLQNSLDVIAGYSDHIEENFACYCAVALGAKVIEKHFTLDRSLLGPDHKASLNPSQFSELLAGIRATEISLGSPIKRPSVDEKSNIQGMRRSLVASRKILKGEILLESAIEFKRPATGLRPEKLALVVGRKVTRDILYNEQISYEMIDWN